jgi:hypothetical protein
MGTYCLKHGINCINLNSQTGTASDNRAAENSAQITQQRVQAIPIINGIIPKQNIEINSSQLVGTTVEAARQTSNYTVYDINSVSSFAASICFPTNKDTLAYFIKYHTTTDFNSSISLPEFVETFKKYHASNSLKYFNNSENITGNMVLRRFICVNIVGVKTPC